MKTVKTDVGALRYVKMLYFRIIGRKFTCNLKIRNLLLSCSLKFIGQLIDSALFLVDFRVEFLIDSFEQFLALLRILGYIFLDDEFLLSKAALFSLCIDVVSSADAECFTGHEDLKH